MSSFPSSFDAASGVTAEQAAGQKNQTKKKVSLLSFSNGQGLLRNVEKEAEPELTAQQNDNNNNNNNNEESQEQNKNDTTNDNNNNNNEESQEQNKNDTTNDNNNNNNNNVESQEQNKMESCSFGYGSQQKGKGQEKEEKYPRRRVLQHWTTGRG